MGRIHHQLLVTAALVAAPALAQTAPAPEAPAPAATATPTDDIVVTGSRIRRPDYEAPNPIVSFDAAKLQQSGNTNVTEFLRRIPALTNSLDSTRTAGNAQAFVRQVFDAFAAEMVVSDFQYGCLMQNLANELPALDAELTRRVARGFADSTEIIAAHFRDCGFAPARAASSAAALTAALEGARTIARLERTPAIFAALADVSVQRWTAPEE